MTLNSYDINIAKMALACHNARWNYALGVWFAHSGLQWTPQVIVNADLRGVMECFLPWEDIASSFRRIGRSFLPGEEWLPRMLADGVLDSVIDFWQEIPEMSGRLALEEDGLLRFFCILADPPRYGTSIGRYPNQLTCLKKLHVGTPRLLDIGCGIGLGTLEAAQRLGAYEVCGITSEPLEVWMANHRLLPHDPMRNEIFRRYDGISASFQLGCAEEFAVEGKYDIILCNGLAGGRFLKQHDDVCSFLDNCCRALASSGVLALANAFHDGCRRDVENLLNHAASAGWKIIGNWHDAYLTR